VLQVDCDEVAASKNAMYFALVREDVNFGGTFTTGEGLLKDHMTHRVDHENSLV